MEVLVDFLEGDPDQPLVSGCVYHAAHFYVGSDGNHRTCIARFFLAEQQKSQLHDVTLNHYQVNDRGRSRGMRLRLPLLRVPP